MGLFDPIRRRLRAFQALARNPSIFYRAVWTNDLVKEYIIFLNTDNQLRLGKRADGSPMRPYRSPSYLAFKKSLSSRLISGPETDLYVTGFFQSTYNVVVRGDEPQITAQTQIYGKDFEEIYGQIVGLSPENKENLREFLKEIAPEILSEEIRRLSL